MSSEMLEDPTKAAWKAKKKNVVMTSPSAERSAKVEQMRKAAIEKKAAEIRAQQAAAEAPPLEESANEEIAMESAEGVNPEEGGVPVTELSLAQPEEAPAEPVSEQEPAGKLEVGLAEAGSRGEVAKSELVIAQVNKAESQAKGIANAEIIAVKKLEAGMDPEDLKEMLAGELEEIEDTINGLEEDQPVLRETAVNQRENLRAQLQAVENYQRGKAAGAPEQQRETGV